MYTIDDAAKARAISAALHDAKPTRWTEEEVKQFIEDLRLAGYVILHVKTFLHVKK